MGLSALPSDTAAAVRYSIRPSDKFLPGYNGWRHVATRGTNNTALSNGTDMGNNSIQIVRVYEALSAPIFKYENSYVSTDKDTPGTNPVDYSCAVEYPVGSGQWYIGQALGDNSAVMTLQPGAYGGMCVWGLSVPAGADIAIRSNASVARYGVGAKFPVGNRSTSGVVGGLADKSTNYTNLVAVVSASAAAAAIALTVVALAATIPASTVLYLISGYGPQTITATGGANTAGATTMNVSAIGDLIFAGAVYSTAPANNLTTSGTAAGGLSNSLSNMVAPHAVINGARSSVRSVLILGDSNSRGEGETLTPSFRSDGAVFCYYEHGGPYVRACWRNTTTPTPFIFEGKNNARADLTRAGLNGRLHWVPFVTDVVLHYGTNDWITGGRSAVQIQADVVAIATQIKLINPACKVWVAAIPPSTTSGGLGGRTLADQTVKANEVTVRQAYNTAMALLPSPIDGFLDIATPFQDAGTGKVIAATDVRLSQSTASSTASTVTITGAAYVVNELVGYSILTQGGGTSALRIIRSNTANVITIDGSWAANPVGAELLDVFNGYWGKDGLHLSPLWIEAAATIAKNTMGL